MTLFTRNTYKQTSTLIVTTLISSLLFTGMGAQAQKYQFQTYNDTNTATPVNKQTSLSSAANKLVGKWQCTAKKDSGMVDIDITKDITYHADGTSESIGKAVLSAFIGSMTTNLTAKGTWTFDGKTFASVTKSGTLTSDYMEAEQRESLQEKINKQETDYADITFLSDNKFQATDSKDKDLTQTCERI